MAWLANPFAYIGINTLIAVMPGIARRLELSTMLAGFWGSLWCFARFGTFVGLWLWPGWHYRFRWLLAAYLALVCAFITILLAPNLPVLVAAQVVFGGAVGLIYYSSLFYSMDMQRDQGRARRHPRIGDWPGQLRRPGRRRRGAAIPAALQPQRRAGRHGLAALRARRPDRHLVVGKGLLTNPRRAPRRPRLLCIVNARRIPSLTRLAKSATPWPLGWTPS